MIFLGPFSLLPELLTQGFPLKGVFGRKGVICLITNFPDALFPPQGRKEMTAIAVFVPDHLTDDGLIPWPSSTKQMNIQLSFNTLQIFKTITKLKT